jgi:hypothetical protein
MANWRDLERNEKERKQFNENIKSKHKTDFICRVCGYVDYDEIIVETHNDSGLFGGDSHIIRSVKGYKCTKCSVLFADPELFSKK